MVQLRPDPKLIRPALQALGVGPNRITELRVLMAMMKGSYHPQTRSGYFNDIEALIRAVCQVESAKGWYITLNPVLPDLFARRSNRADRAGNGETTKDDQILNRTWFPIDLDPVHISGVSATEEEHQFALDRAREVAAYLKSKGWPAPIVADSGNGGHLLYPIDLPRDDGGLIAHCLKALDKRFSDDRATVDTSVFNPARIWKLYGTPACKGDSTPDRPHRMARLLEVPDGI